MRAMGILAAAGGKVEIVYRPTTFSEVLNTNQTQTHSSVPVGDGFEGRILAICATFDSAAERAFSVTSVAGQAPILAVQASGGATEANAGIWLLEDISNSSVNVTLDTGTGGGGVSRRTSVAVYGLKGAALIPRAVQSDLDTLASAHTTSLNGAVNSVASGAVLGCGVIRRSGSGSTATLTGLSVDAEDPPKWPVFGSAEVESTENPRAITYAIDAAGGGFEGALAVCSLEPR